MNVTTPTYANQLQRPPAPPPQTVYRPWGQRIKLSLKARWLGYPFIIAMVALSVVIGTAIQGRDRFFVERDPTISYPFVNNTVPSWSLAFIGAIGPIFLIICTQVAIRKSPHTALWDSRTKDIHLAIIVLGEVLAVTYLITNILKSYVGRLRPNFFAYCNYKGYRDALASGDLSTYLANTVPGAVGDFRFCSDDQNDAHFSFPSGHASISFCGLTFLSLFLLHVLGRIDFRHHGVGKIVRCLSVIIPMFAGAIVCASRIVDYQHNAEDTVWGALIGIFASFLVFHGNYAYARPTEGGVGAGHISQFHGDDHNMGTNMVPTTSDHVGKIRTTSPLVSRVPSETV